MLHVNIRTGGGGGLSLQPEVSARSLTRFVFRILQFPDSLNDRGFMRVERNVKICEMFTRTAVC